MVVGDVKARRAVFDPMQQAMFDQIAATEDVDIQVFETNGEDGGAIQLRWYQKAGAPTGPAVLYIHGGGMIASSAKMYDRPVAQYVAATGVPFLSVEYRYAPEFPAPTPTTDCYAGLQWLADEGARRFGVDPDRIAVMGDSSGGGTAASVAIYARDHDGPS